MPDIRICPITSKAIKNYQEGRNGFFYDVTIEDKTFTVGFCRNCFKEINFEKHKYLLNALLLNNKLDGEVIHYTADKSSHEDEFNFLTFIEEGDYPKTHKEKLNNLFLKLFRMRNFEGEPINFTLNRENLLWHKYYFKNLQEFLFYFDTLVNEKYLHQLLQIETEASSTLIQCKVTFEGLNYAIKIQEEGQNSKNCFIAMSFANTPQAKETRKAIKDAIKATGFNPVIVDEENIDSDTTINDKIIANLKKCKFCIADFTGQSKGVYFESGFALGQGKKVIYTCEKEDFKKAHFDIKPLQHIIYETPDELKGKLIDKIEAWVK